MTLNTSLANHLLIAMPSVDDSFFNKSVIYICEHHVQGSVGLMINQPMKFPLGFVFEQLQIQPERDEKNYTPLLCGGPIQPERGFVLHRPFGEWSSSLALREDVTVTTSNDIIKAIAVDKGPEDALITLGFSMWEESQLEQEMLDNLWLVCPCTPELLYEVPFEKRWEYAGSSIGVDMNTLTVNIGHA